MVIIDLQMNIEDIDRLKATLTETQTLKWYKIDVSDQKALDFQYRQIFMEMNNQLNCVINAAGIFNEKQLERSILVNFGGVINSSLCAMRLMSKEEEQNSSNCDDGGDGGGGIICNISSSAVFDQQLSFLPIYTATKAAILNFTYSMSVSQFFIENCYKNNLINDNNLIHVYIYLFIE